MGQGFSKVAKLIFLLGEGKQKRELLRGPVA